MLKYFISTLLFFVSLSSFSAEFVAGKDYEILKAADSRALVNHRVVVTEFFSYGCPWCNRLESSLNPWLKQHQNTIHFKKVPVVFNKDWDYYAKAYFAAEALSLNSTLNPALFKAILQDKKELKSNQAMIDFFIQQGVDPTTAKSAFNASTYVDMSVKESIALMARDHINAVPAFVVGNQFKTDLQQAKTEERLFAILDFLIAKSSQKPQKTS